VGPVVPEANGIKTMQFPPNAICDSSRVFFTGIRLPSTVYSELQRGPKVTFLVAPNVCKGSAVVTRGSAVLTQMFCKRVANVLQMLLQMFCKCNADMFNSSTRGIMKINKPTWWLILLKLYIIGRRMAHHS
jgi:hypothetical protein